MPNCAVRKINHMCSHNHCRQLCMSDMHKESLGDNCNKSKPKWPSTKLVAAEASGRHGAL